MSFKALNFVLALGASAIVLGPSQAHEYRAGPLKIGHPWSLATPAGAPTAAGYLTITNLGSAPERFLGGASSEARKVEIHRMTMNGGIMRMREITEGIPIAPGQTVSFDPSGYHLMIIGPKHAFKVGDHVPVTLKFATAGEVKVEFYVQSRTVQPMKSDHMDMH